MAVVPSLSLGKIYWILRWQQWGKMYSIARAGRPPSERESLPPNQDLVTVGFSPSETIRPQGTIDGFGGQARRVKRTERSAPIPSVYVRLLPPPTNWAILPLTGSAALRAASHTTSWLLRYVTSCLSTNHSRRPAAPDYRTPAIAYYLPPAIL